DKMFLLKHKKMLDNLDMKSFKNNLTLFFKNDFGKEFLLFAKLTFEVFLEVVVMNLERNKVSIMFFFVSLFSRLSTTEKVFGFCSKDGCELNLFKYTFKKKKINFLKSIYASLRYWKDLKFTVNDIEQNIKMLFDVVFREYFTYRFGIDSAKNFLDCFAANIQNIFLRINPI
ncbi:hypothetical protein H311_01945, partial [Anncaliia algerae PRA109]